MVAICAMAGFSIDVSSWFQAHRKQQAVADAAALAGAGSLPADIDQAVADAQAYAIKNDGSLASGAVTFSTKYLPNDTITVQTSKTTPSYFLKAVNIDGTTVTATAVARAETLGSAWGSAPFAVINTQPQLAGPGCPCLGTPTTLDLLKVGPGGFKVLDIDGSRGGTGSTILADWILNGCDCSTDTRSGCSTTPGPSSPVPGAGRDDRTHRIEPALPGLRRPTGRRHRAPVPHHRLHRLPPHELRSPFELGDDRRVLRQGELEGNRLGLGFQLLRRDDDAARGLKPLDRPKGAPPCR
jgi:hypothetical protein